MRVVVTGGSGFLGGYVVPELRKEGHDVIGLARGSTAASRLSTLGARAIKGDLDDPGSIDEAFAFARADALINLASLGFGHAPVILAAAEEAGISRGVFVSTTAIFTTLPAQSRASRMSAEAAIRASALGWTIVRPTMIYGAEGDRNMVRLLRLLRRTSLIPIPGGGECLLQPVHVADVANFIVRVACTAETIGESYNVAGPDAITLREVVATAAAALGRRSRVVPIPLGPAVAAVRVYESLLPRPYLKAEQLLRLAEDKSVDIRPAMALGYRPMSFARGISLEAGLLA